MGRIRRNIIHEHAIVRSNEEFITEWKNRLYMPVDLRAARKVGIIAYAYIKRVQVRIAHCVEIIIDHSESGHGSSYSIGRICCRRRGISRKSRNSITKRAGETRIY